MKKQRSEETIRANVVDSEKKVVNSSRNVEINEKQQRKGLRGRGYGPSSFAASSRRSLPSPPFFFWRASKKKVRRKQRMRTVEGCRCQLSGVRCMWCAVHWCDEGLRGEERMEKRKTSLPSGLCQLVWVLDCKQTQRRI